VLSRPGSDVGWACRSIAGPPFAQMAFGDSLTYQYLASHYPAARLAWIRVKPMLSADPARMTMGNVGCYENWQFGVIEVFQLNKRLIGAAFVGSLGGFVFGYDLGALSASTQSLKDQFHLAPVAFGLTVSCSLWGTICGSLLAGRLADTVGRRNLIAGCSILYALGAIGIALPVPLDWSLVLVMRFLCGMAIGGFTVGCPLYLSELAPIALRGRLVSMFQVQIGVGAVVAFSVGSLFAQLIAARDVWKWCLGVGAVPAVVLLFLLQFVPRSEPRRAVSRSQGGDHTIGTTGASDGSRGHERLFCRKNMRPILLATSVAVFNQLSGVNVLLLYLLEILSSAGIGLVLGHTYTVLISCLGLATTLLGMAFVDKLGRKPLLVVGSAGMAVCLLGLGLAIPHRFSPLLYLSILVAYNAFFAFSQGTVVWVYLSELFPPGVRGAGQGYGSSVHWIANAILISVFPMMQHASSVLTFYFFAFMMILQIGVVLLWYPETRGTALGSVAEEESANGPLFTGNG
jgi:MFS transporter, SP family, arabinose:H+ symporter